MFDTVDNLFFVIAENNIAVLAHNLNNKMFYAQVAKLVKMLDLDIEDALKTGLGDWKDSRAVKMFAKQHAEIRRGHRVRLCCLWQVD